jgi:hypothetical protein
MQFKKNKIMKIRKFKKILIESGLRDVNSLAQKYSKAEIYFHQDL